MEIYGNNLVLLLMYSETFTHDIFLVGKHINVVAISRGIIINFKLKSISNNVFSSWLKIYIVGKLISFLIKNSFSAEIVWRQIFPLLFFFSFHT